MVNMIFDIVYACSDLISYVYTIMTTPVESIFNLLFDGGSLLISNVFFGGTIDNFIIPDIPIIADIGRGLLALFFAGLDWTQPFVVCFILATCRFWFLILITKGIIEVLKTIF